MKEDLRVVFIGTPYFAKRMLEALFEEKYNIVAVVSQPNKPVGRKQEVVETPVAQFAHMHNIPVLQPESLKEEYEAVLAYQPDFILTCAYGQIIPNALFENIPYGCLNIHPSLLPKYRGGAPIHRAIMNGDQKTGVCLMEVVAKMDAGDVYAVYQQEIDELDTTTTLSEKLIDQSIAIIKHELPKYFAKQLQPVKQDETKVVIARNISKQEEHVVFSNRDVTTIYNHIRALIDSPIGYGMIDNKRIKFYDVRMKKCNVDQPSGTILGFSKQGMEVACSDGILYVLKLQPEGKKVMSSSEFANGQGKSLIGKVFA